MSIAHVLVFCGVGGRAAGAVTALKELGYSNVRNRELQVRWFHRTFHSRFATSNFPFFPFLLPFFRYITSVDSKILATFHEYSTIFYSTFEQKR